MFLKAYININNVIVKYEYSLFSLNPIMLCVLSDVFAMIHAVLMCYLIRFCILQYIITEQYFHAIMAMLFYQFLQSIIYIKTKKKTNFLLIMLETY